MSNAYAVSEPTKEQLRKEGNNVLDDDKRSETGSVRESTEKVLGEKTEVPLSSISLIISAHPSCKW
jgi:hypothetical protein